MEASLSFAHEKDDRDSILEMLSKVAEKDSLYINQRIQDILQASILSVGWGRRGITATIL